MGPTGAGSSGKPSISSRTIRLVISRALGCFSGAFALATSNTAGNTLLALRPWCTDQRGGRTDPQPRPGSRDADGLRAPELQHPVQGTSGDGDLGRPARVGARAQRVTDHPLVAGHGCLGQRATVVAGGFLPAHTAGGFYAKCNGCRGEVRAARSGPPGAAGTLPWASGSRGNAGACR